MFAFAAAADLLLSRLDGASGVVYRAALALMVAAPLLLAVSTVRSSYDRGAGSYSTTEWRNNLLAQEVLARPPDHCSYYSNAPDAVYATTGIHAYWTPKKAGPPMYGFDAFHRARNASR